VNYLIHRHLRRSGEAGAAGLASTATDKGIRRFALTEYVGAVGEIVVVNGMPVIVALAIGVSESAGFSIGWLIVMMLEVVIIQFCSSLTVEGARHPEQLSTLVLVAARRLFPLGLIMTVGVVVIGPFALSIFGSAYRAEGLATLQIAALALVPRVVIQLRLAVARIQTDLRTQLVVPLASMVATLAIALPLIRPIGAAGIAWGYLIASTGLALALIPGFPTIREART
jgi:O-antigen/teichoic acid export membrane protein